MMLSKKSEERGSKPVQKDVVVREDLRVNILSIERGGPDALSTRGRQRSVTRSMWVKNMNGEIGY